MLRGGTWNTQAIWNTRGSEKDQAGGVIGSTGEEFGVLMTIISAMVLLGKLR